MRPLGVVEADPVFDHLFGLEAVLQFMQIDRHSLSIKCGLYYKPTIRSSGIASPEVVTKSRGLSGERVSEYHILRERC